MSTAWLLEAHAVTIEAPGGRTLVRELSLRLGRDRVAVVGRNGVGKSTLLEVLAGRLAATRGRVVCRGRRLLVSQHLAGEVVADNPPAASPGERRRQRLRTALDARPDLLFLDEPTLDLDAAGITWLLERLALWRDGLLVVSHDRRVLRAFNQHLDFVGLAALEAVLAAWPGGLLVVGHDPEFLDAIGVSARLDL